LRLMETFRAYIMSSYGLLEKGTLLIWFADRQFIKMYYTCQVYQPVAR
jgi:hypothetical protein